MTSSSPRFSLNGTDAWKALRTGLVVAAAAFIGYVLQILPGADLGKYMFLMPLITFALEASRRFLTDNSSK